jgi:hypothetical protein
MFDWNGADAQVTMNRAQRLGWFDVDDYLL